MAKINNELKPKNGHNTQAWKRPQKLEEMSEECETEQTGYISNSLRIRQMISAGQRLMASRQNDFDFVVDKVLDDADLEDITRKRNVDLVEVADLHKKVLKRIKDKNQEIREKNRAEERIKQKQLLKDEIIKEIDSAKNEEKPEVKTPKKKESTD